MTTPLSALRIIKYPDPRLRKPCKPVETFDDHLARLAGRMLVLMHEADGIGLAAPQVGVLLRMFVCNPTGQPGEDRVFVNPWISDVGETVVAEEGCLSLPEVHVDMRRAAGCTIHACDTAGRAFSMSGNDLIARCWQHECDHLDGRLIIDRMNEADRIVNRRVLRALEREFKRVAPAR